jgi:hypothetical protein
MRQDFERRGHAKPGSLVEKYSTIALITIAIHKLSTGCEKLLWKTFPRSRDRSVDLRDRASTNLTGRIGPLSVRIELSGF